MESLTCPDCDGQQWEILADPSAVDGEIDLSAVCPCGYTMGLGTVRAADMREMS